MIHIEKGDISLSIEEPAVGYNFSRFDWTGKIVQMTCNDVSFCTDESLNGDEESMGRGFYNEFGIDQPIGYNQVSVGESFPKIGVGSLLKSSNESYDFMKFYDIHKYDFSVKKEDSWINIQCVNDSGKYPFILEKEIRIIDSGFQICYRLENRGELTLNTTEYVHNFLSPGGSRIGKHTNLVFSGNIDPLQFHSGLNPDNVMSFQKNTIQWSKTPQSDFFYDSISRPVTTGAAWSLSDNRLGIGIRETVDFEPIKINLWGRDHVVSPEVFKGIKLVGGEADFWCRSFTVFSP